MNKYYTELSNGLVELIGIINQLVDHPVIKTANERINDLCISGKKMLAEYYYKFVCKPFWEAIEERDITIFGEDYVSSSLDLDSDNIGLIGIFRDHWEEFPEDYKEYIWKKLHAINWVSKKIHRMNI